jgi:hypothetical protein
VPFVGQYQFEIMKHKQNDRYGLYQVELTVQLMQQPTASKATSIKRSKVLTYRYNLFVTRLFAKA